MTMMGAWGTDWKKADSAFLSWLRTQPSCLSGSFSEYVNGIGRNPACHVRSSANSGTGMKPRFSAVSLTHEEHFLQHRSGEKALLESYYGRKFSIGEAREFFNSQAKKAYNKWMKGK